MMSTTKSLKQLVQLVLLLLLVVVAAVNGQDVPPEEQQQEVQQQQQQQGGGGGCECPVTQERHDQCVQDYWQQHDLRQALEQQLHDAQAQANGRVSMVEEQLRQECQTRVEEIEANSRSEQELAQEQTSSLKVEVQKLKSDVQERSVALQEAHNMASNSRRALEETQQELDNMKKARTIITIDYDLLQERLEGMKTALMDYSHDFLTFCQVHWEVAKEKMMEVWAIVKEKLLEFWKYLDTKVFPEIKRFVEQDALPLMKKTYHDGRTFVKKTYAPYREPVNQKVAQARTVWNKNYQKHLEPKVKEYQLDVYAAKARDQVLAAKDQAVVYMNQGHDQLVDSIRQGSKIALKTFKSEGAPDFLIEHTEFIKKNPQDAARSIELFVGAIVAYYLLKYLLFGGKKKNSGKKKRSKAEWEKEQKQKQQMKNGGIPSSNKQKQKQQQQQKGKKK